MPVPNSGLLLPSSGIMERVFLERMMKKYFVTFFLFVVMTVSIYSVDGRGHLFIIGGGERSESMMKEFISLAAAHGSGKIIVFPMASSVPLEVGPEQAQQFLDWGAASAESHILNRAEAKDTESARLLDGIGGVFFSGGDQSRLADVLLGTPLLDAIKKLYEEGGVVGGTSAGAAVMSAVMITGDEKRPPGEDRAFETIEADNIITAPGFGFVQDMIVDQHFIRRRRLNRLISLVLEYPKLLGVGIDEGTAILVSPDRTFKVVGESQVLIFDAADARIRRRNDFRVSAEGLNFFVLFAGDVFDLERRKVVR